MLKSIIRLLMQKGLMSQVLESTDAMLEKAEQATRAALAALLEKTPPGFDIYALDRELNQAEVDIRRMILRHLSVNPASDINPALLVTSTIISIERIGDYAKNIYELAVRFPEPFEGPYTDRVRECVDRALGMFGDTRRAFADDDQDLARRVMQTHAELGRCCESTIDDLLADQEVSARQAVLVALTARFIKRVSAHLSNLASGVVNPFDRVGFQPGSEPPEDVDT